MFVFVARLFNFCLLPKHQRRFCLTKKSFSVVKRSVYLRLRFGASAYNPRTAKVEGDGETPMYVGGKISWSALLVVALSIACFTLSYFWKYSSIESNASLPTNVPPTASTIVATSNFFFNLFISEDLRWFIFRHLTSSDSAFFLWQSQVHLLFISFSLSIKAYKRCSP